MEKRRSTAVSMLGLSKILYMFTREHPYWRERAETVTPRCSITCRICCPMCMAIPAQWRPFAPGAINKRGCAVMKKRGCSSLAARPAHIGSRIALTHRTSNTQRPTLYICPSLSEYLLYNIYNRYKEGKVSYILPRAPTVALSGHVS